MVQIEKIFRCIDLKIIVHKVGFDIFFFFGGGAKPNFCIRWWDSSFEGLEIVKYLFVAITLRSTLI